MRYLKHSLRPALLAAVLVLAAGCGDLMDPDEPGNLVPKTVDEDPTLPALDMAGSRFHLETQGDADGPVVIFLHGGPGGDYRSLLKMAERFDGYALGDDHRLVFWDQRGCGLSRRHDKDVLTIDRYVQDLDELIDIYSPDEPVILIGLSWGGMYATAYINRHPERVRAAVLMEPGPLSGAYYDLVKDDMQDMDVTAEWLNDWVWSQEILTPDDHARMDYQRCLGIRDSQPRFHQQMDPPAPFWRLGAVANRYIEEDGQDDDGNMVYDFTTDLAAFTPDVLFLASGWNEVIGRDFQARQVEAYPNATLKVVEDCGHDLEWVKTAEVMAYVRSYLERIEQSEKGRIR